LVIAHRHIDDMLERRPMAHFAIDARLLELQIVRFKTSALHIAQLAGVTNRTNGLVAGRSPELFPRAQISPFTPRQINDFPVIDPLFVQCTVLDGKNVNLAVRQFGCVSLLKFGTDRVVHRIAVPCAVRLLDIEIVPAVTSNHVSEQRSITTASHLSFPVAVTGFIVQMKFIVGLEIAYHTLRSIGPKHL